jgi:hypothetical protein
MAKFLPDLANEMEPICELTRKEVHWNWSNEHELAFQNVKKRLTEAPILAYFDTNKEVVLQVDSSKNGVGAVSLQDGKPVEFASLCANTFRKKLVAKRKRSTVHVVWTRNVLQSNCTERP